MSASIITIGDELLIGQVIDTNSAWIAQQLNKIGIPLNRRVAVADSAEAIRYALDDESALSDVILLTGGLGPTSDDVTKPVLCDYFNAKLVINEEALNNVHCLFEQVFKREVTERNRKQAEVPDNCTVIQNRRGTAPGMLFEKNGVLYFSLPGVPHEMKGMIETDVLPLLQARVPGAVLQHRTLVCYGIGESALAERIESFEAELPETIKLAYLPHDGMVRLRLSTTASNSQVNIDALFENLQTEVKPFLISTEDETMEEIVSRMLLERNETVGTAESCTGGFIAHLLSRKPGASAYYSGSMVTYSYQAKEDLLNVSNSSLINNGAVSEEVVKEMAQGLLSNLKSGYAIAVSGILGPEGGLPGKPVGTVWMAAGNKQQIVTKKIQLRFNREKNIQVAAMNALNLLRTFMLGEN